MRNDETPEIGKRSTRTLSSNFDDLEYQYSGLDSAATPVGYWNTEEVLGRLLPLWWGERSKLADTHLLGYEINGKALGKWCGSLEQLEQDAQWREIMRIFRDGAASGEIEVRYQNGGSIDRIPQSHWSKLTDQELRDNLMHGKPWAPFLDEDTKIGKVGAPFIVNTEDAANWLRGLTSPHVLPEPMLRDPDFLLDDHTVSISEAVSWLADGVPQTASAMRSQARESARWFDEQVKLYRTGDIEHKPERALADFIATELARIARSSAVVRLIEREIVEGGLKIWGRRGEKELDEVPPRAFLSGMHLWPMHDSIDVDGDMTMEDFRVARSEGAYNRACFSRADIVRLWGGVVEQPASPSANTDEHDFPESFPSLPDKKPLDQSQAKDLVRGFLEHIKERGVRCTSPERQKWVQAALGCNREKAREYLDELSTDEMKKGGRRPRA